MTDRRKVRHPLAPSSKADPIAPLVGMGLLAQVTLTADSLAAFMEAKAMTLGAFAARLADRVASRWPLE